MDKKFVIDFDSTFTRVEGLDLLCEISLKENPERNTIVDKIQEITQKGMNGDIDFKSSLQQRIALLKAGKKDITELIHMLKKQVTKSIARNKSFFECYTESIYIISNGFKEFIIPVVKDYYIKPSHVFANEFIFDANEQIIGFNTNNILSQNGGKPLQIKELGLKGDIYVIGDGYNDYEMKASGFATKFFAFTENVSREKVLEKADYITPSFDDFLYINKMNTITSYPKNRIKVLLLENIHPKAAEIFKNEGYTVETYPAGLEENELKEKIKDISILCIRSKTQVTKEVLENASRLISIGAFCIGTNQIDGEYAMKKGVLVFNAPFSNTRSVVELAIGEIIMLMRNIPDKILQMHQGKWNKSAGNSFEVRGKILGIIGYGNIGSQLSVLAEAIGMKVCFFDTEEKLAIGNALRCNSLDTLLSLADVITIHVDGRKSNKNIIGKKEFEKMKDGVIFLNLSRGHVVDIDSLRENILHKKIAGAAIDVFPYEPISNEEEFINELRGLPNTILTPHIGGSTLEAQENIGSFVPNRIMDYINTGSTSGAVNFPTVSLPHFENAHRFLHIHSNIPGIMAKINNIFSKHAINIVGQYLKTNAEIGYVITDINKDYNPDILKELKSIQGTIRFRCLY